MVDRPTHIPIKAPEASGGQGLERYRPPVARFQRAGSLRTSNVALTWGTGERCRATRGLEAITHTFNRTSILRLLLHKQLDASDGGGCAASESASMHCFSNTFGLSYRSPSFCLALRLATPSSCSQLFATLAASGWTLRSMQHAMHPSCASVANEALVGWAVLGGVTSGALSPPE